MLVAVLSARAGHPRPLRMLRGGLRRGRDLVRALRTATCKAQGHRDLARTADRGPRHVRGSGRWRARSGHAGRAGTATGIRVRTRGSRRPGSLGRHGRCARAGRHGPRERLQPAGAWRADACSPHQRTSSASRGRSTLCRRASSAAAYTVGARHGHDDTVTARLRRPYTRTRVDVVRHGRAHVRRSHAPVIGAVSDLAALMR
jgi:hypothetical protein